MYIDFTYIVKWRCRRMFWEIDGLHIDYNVLVAQAGIRPILLASVVGEGHGLDIVIVGLVHYDPEQGTLA